MTAQELRIGNYIKTDDDIICIVSRIESKDYTHWNSGDRFSITALELNTKDDYLNTINDKWQPIELTEEILLKSGFVPCSIIENDFNIKGMCIWKCNDMFLCDKNGVHIKHLHQLQNLYFYLTGEELNIDL